MREKCLGGTFVLSSYRKPRKEDWIRTLVYIAAYLMAIGFSSFYLFLSYWYLWAALVIGGLMILVYWHAKATAHHCTRCDNEFQISILANFFSPHGVDREGGWAYLKCPNCSNRSRMKILINTTDKKPSVRFHKRCKLLLADSTEGDKQMSDVEGKPDTLRVRIRTERGFDKEYDLLEDKILARFQKKREDVKSVTWSDNIGGSLYTELGVASPYHPLIGSGSASIEFRDGTYTRICDVFYQDFNQKRTHYDGLPHWNHERRFEMPSRVEWDKNPGETHGIDKSLWIEVYVSNTCGNQFKKRAYWQELDIQ